MIERTLWHPVALAHAVGAQPVAAVLLGEELVLWRDGEGAAHAWADQCPHRGARFSLGRVTDGQLECPYHGWRFQAGGQCTHIPAVPGFTPGARHCARTFDTREAHGMLWVRLAAPEGRRCQSTTCPPSPPRPSRACARPPAAPTWCRPARRASSRTSSTWRTSATCTKAGWAAASGPKSRRMKSPPRCTA
nr:Rieske (2Fe-2S) protein [Ottowia beijingensis]